MDISKFFLFRGRRNYCFSGLSILWWKTVCVLIWCSLEVRTFYIFRFSGTEMEKGCNLCFSNLWNKTLLAESVVTTLADRATGVRVSKLATVNSSWARIVFTEKNSEFDLANILKWFNCKSQFCFTEKYQTYCLNTNVCSSMLNCAITSVIKLLDFLLPGKSIIYFSNYPSTRVPEYRVPK